MDMKQPQISGTELRTQKKTFLVWSTTYMTKEVKIYNGVMTVSATSGVGENGPFSLLTKINSKWLKDQKTQVINYGHQCK